MRIAPAQRPASELTDSLEAASAQASALFNRLIRDVELGPVQPPHQMNEIREHFRATLGEEGIGLEALIAELEEEVFPRSIRIANPMYAGLVQSSPLPGAALADSLISAINNNAGASHQGPAATACEEEAVRALAGMLGLDAQWDGLFLAGGTFATLQGLLLARSHAFPEALPSEARLYTSQAAHFSIARAAQITGLAAQAVVAIPTLGRGQIDVEALRARIQQDRAAGLKPYAVGVTFGTTGTGALDPIAEVAELCAIEGLWLHVDACYGAAACLLPEFAEQRAALQLADSISLDAHKWLFMPLTAGLVLTRHPEIAARTFDHDASYIPGHELEAWQRGMPTSRRAAGLTVWAGLRAHGFRPIREAVERNIGHARLAEQLLRDAGFQVLGGGELSVACARWVPPSISLEESNALQGQIAESVADSGGAWFSTVRHDGKIWLRLNFTNLYTRDEHVERMVKLIREAADEGMPGGFQPGMLPGGLCADATGSHAAAPRR
jgi:aromatic-L-amino-acid decarboxylase